MHGAPIFVVIEAAGNADPSLRLPHLTIVRRGPKHAPLRTTSHFRGENLVTIEAEVYQLLWSPTHAR
jgi:hypothetical protein